MKQEEMIQEIKELTHFQRSLIEYRPLFLVKGILTNGKPFIEIIEFLTKKGVLRRETAYEIQQVFPERRYAGYVLEKEIEHLSETEHAWFIYCFDEGIDEAVIQIKEKMKEKLDQEINRLMNERNQL